VLNLLMSTLHSLPVFEDLGEEEARDLASHCEGVDLPDGTILFEEGEDAPHLYVVLAGTILLSCRGPSGTEVVVGMSKPGSVIGEMGVLDNAPRSATATAVGHSGVLRIAGDAFKEMIQSGNPAAWSILKAIRMELCQRLRTLDERVDAVFTIHDPSRPLGESAEVKDMLENLWTALSQEG